MSAWEGLKTQIKTLHEKRGVNWKAVADEISVPTKTLTSYLSNDRPPSEATAAKIKAWVLRQTGGKPAPRVKTQAHKVTGPAQLRRSKNRRERTIVGGHAPRSAAATGSSASMIEP